MKSVLFFILVIVATFAVQHYILMPKIANVPAAPAKTESAYERVMRTRTLRCGYNIWEPAIIQDQSGKLTGAYVEFMEALANAAGLKLEWTAKLDWGTFPADLETGKVDAMCAGVWADSKRGTVTGWTDPIWYNTIEAEVRPDDERFPESQDKLARLNSEDITIAIVDGTAASQMAAVLYPKAKKYNESAVAGAGDYLMTVVTRKADVVFTDSGTARTFRSNNPGKLRRYAPHETVAVYPQSIGVNIHEVELKNMLDTATHEVLNLGIAEGIARKYDPEGAIFILPSQPYKSQ